MTKNFLRIAKWHVFDKSHEKNFYGLQDGMFLTRHMKKFFTNCKIVAFLKFDEVFLIFNTLARTTGWYSTGQNQNFSF